MLTSVNLNIIVLKNRFHFFFSDKMLPLSQVFWTKLWESDQDLVEIFIFHTCNIEQDAFPVRHVHTCWKYCRWVWARGGVCVDGYRRQDEQDQRSPHRPSVMSSFAVPWVQFLLPETCVFLFISRWLPSFHFAPYSCSGPFPAVFTKGLTWPHY